MTALSKEIASIASKIEKGEYGEYGYYQWRRSSKAIESGPINPVVCRTASMNRLLKRAHSTTHNVPLPLIHTHSPRAPPSATLYTIPQHAPDLPKLLHHLQHTFPNSIGCLSSSSPSISIAHFYDTDRTTYHLFRSTEKGKAPAAVGRWRPPGEISGLEGLKKDDDVLEDAFARGDWAGVWGDGTPGGNSPQEQVELAGLEGVERSQIQTALLLSTPASLSPTVHLLPPGSQKAGLIVPQTPFTTGRPHTLFHHTNAYSEGAVGLAIVAHKGAESTKDRLEVRWEGMELVEDRVYQVSGYVPCLRPLPLPGENFADFISIF